MVTQTRHTPTTSVFSMKDELRIGHCQNNNYRCNGCGISHDKADLSKYSKYAAIYGEIRI